MMYRIDFCPEKFSVRLSKFQEFCSRNTSRQLAKTGKLFLQPVGRKPTLGRTLSLNLLYCTTDEPHRYRHLSGQNLEDWHHLLLIFLLLKTTFFHRTPVTYLPNEDEFLLEFDRFATFPQFQASVEEPSTPTISYLCASSQSR